VALSSFRSVSSLGPTDPAVSLEWGWLSEEGDHLALASQDWARRWGSEPLQLHGGQPETLQPSEITAEGAEFLPCRPAIISR
jgi:hypothetical protein